jgi:transcriptional regulator with XRE-family HTH domain
MLGARVREIREYRNLNQDDVGRLTGLQRAYVSRFENGHITPSINTLEKIARALNVPLFAFFYPESESTAEQLHAPGAAPLWGDSLKTRRDLMKLRIALQKMTPARRQALLTFAQSMLRNKMG